MLTFARISGRTAGFHAIFSRFAFGDAPCALPSSRSFFLFWAFYELSGGADFRTARPPAHTAGRSGSRPGCAGGGKRLRPAPQSRRANPTQGRQTSRLPKSRRCRSRPPTHRRPPHTSRRAWPRASARVCPFFPPVAGNASLAASGGPIPSLATIAARPASQTETSTTTVTPDTTPTEPDIREIIGTRVNMRDGPGTIYPATARLMLGQKVEVLEDSGTGWLRLKTVQSGLRGWVAASLVSKPAR
ncbi:SH3 domain-containing protein [Jhaorihella thermophila]